MRAVVFSRSRLQCGPLVGSAERGRGPMSFFALATWVTAGGLGLYLLSIWLIEYDREYQAAVATRLPPAVLASHVLIAVGGLIVWSAYLIYDDDNLAWTALAALCMAATLGLTMAFRWYSVYKDTRQQRAVARLMLVSSDGTLTADGTDISEGTVISEGRRAEIPKRFATEGPPERLFPLPVVLAHGFFAFLTIGVVALSVMGVSGS